ncbi:pro-sigmaK processing inhibitor BofA family protein [Ruminococcus sp.]|uniref:pro-sigmaK processing inhibitor BofA family protein n=1 Tax=Ruminococcus sp. TaxID=41978 RepID=UPI00388EEE97
MLLAFVVSASTFLVFSFLHYASKKKKPFRRALFSMAAGLLTLLAVNLLSGVTGVYIPLTRLTLLSSLVGGVPGVGLLALLTAF